MSPRAYTFHTPTVSRRKLKLLSLVPRSTETSSGLQGPSPRSLPANAPAHPSVPPSRRPVSHWSCCSLCWQVTFSFKTLLSHYLLQDVSRDPEAE